MSMKIGVISDTHGLLRPEVLENLRSCDHILHAGDIDTPEILEVLRRIAPVQAVRGNNDGEWAEPLPDHLTFSMEGVRFHMALNRKDLPKDLGSAHVVVFGHSHQYCEQWIDGRLWLNPGSCGRRRFYQDVTFAMMGLDHGDCSVRKILIPRP